MSSTSLLLSNSEYVQNQAKFYSDLLINQELTDVTLACDGYQIGVHRTVISASSLFFRDVIKKNSKQQNLLIFLKGVSEETLDSMLQFIYAGEATVQTENLERLVELGNELKVIGLMEDDVQNKTAKVDQSSKKLTIEKLQETNKQQEKKIQREQTCQGNKRDIKDEEESNDENMDSFKCGGMRAEGVKLEENANKLTIEINKRLMTRKDENDLVVHRCTVCNKELRKKDKMRQHIETHLEGFSHQCKYCDVVKKTTAALQFHQWQFHTRGNTEMDIFTPTISLD